MARVAAIGNEYVNLVLTAREATALFVVVLGERRLLKGRDRAAALRAIRALDEGLTTIENGRKT